VLFDVLPSLKALLALDAVFDELLTVFFAILLSPSVNYINIQFRRTKQY
jgi:hypothetical protein